MNHSIDLEEDLIGTIIFGLEESGAWTGINPDIFYSDLSKRVFNLALENHQKDIPLMTGMDTLDISKFSGKYCSNPQAVIAELESKARKRSLISNLQKSLISLQNDGDINVVSNQLIASLGEISDKQDTLSKISDSLFDVFQKIVEVRSGERKLGLTTDLDFEKYLGGFENGKFYVVAARPAMGKSAFALEIIKRLARLGVPVGMMSLEMSNTSLAMRLLTSDVQIDAGDLRQGKLTDDQMEKIQATCESLSQLPIYFDDNSYVTAQSLRARASFFKQKYGIGMLVIDYLQLMTGDNDSRERDIAEISRMCKIIAKELDIPVLALAQLNRGVEARDDKRPRLSDLRESGAIEQDADAVMFLYRPEYYGIETYPDSEDHIIRGTSTKNICEVIIQKNRDGETGIVRQVFIPNLMVFKNRAPHWTETMPFKSDINVEGSNFDSAPF